MSMEPDRYLPGDKAFRRFVLLGTGLALGALLGSAAALERAGTGGIHFRWHWTVPVWGIAGLLAAWPFWRLIWQVQDHPTRKARIRLGLFCSLLVVVGLGAFLYPARFTAPGTRAELFQGLAVAAAFLAAGALLLFTLVRAFESGDQPPRKG